jgi:hypothetical protein
MESAERHRQWRQTVFGAIVDVLKKEESDWSDWAHASDPKSLERFRYARGVRCASELAIGYLAIKRLLSQGILTNAVVAPERSCGTGRMDLWIGDEPDAAGLGMEFKFLIGKHHLETVAKQARRLCKEQASDGKGAVDAAGFVLWGHGIDEESKLHPARFFLTQQPGWTGWIPEGNESFKAQYQGESKCHVWLWGADRLT